MNKEISVSTPGKLMLLGEHGVVYGKPCLVTAVEQRLSAEISCTENPHLVINAPDVNIENYRKPMSEVGRGDIPRGVVFVENAVANFKNKYSFDEGVSIKTNSDFSASFGFGSSSASTVSVIKGLAEVFGKDLTKQEIFDLSYKTVLDVQGVGSGFDTAAGIYGGTLYFVGGGKEIEELAKNDFNLVVGYSGQKADTTEIIKRVAAEHEESTRVEEIFEEIGELVEEGKVAFEKSDWERFGQIMTENQKLLVELGVSTEKLDTMISAALAGGAYGAKLSGAGGGDCMIALCARDKIDSVKKAILETGGEIIDVKVNAEGVKINS